MSNNSTITIKVNDDLDAGLTPIKDVQLYFKPEFWHGSTQNRWRAQLFYGPAATITSISLAIAKGSSVAWDIPIQIKSFQEDIATSYGLDATDNIVLDWSAGIKIPASSIPMKPNPLTEHLEYVTLSGLSISVTPSEFYWLIWDMGWTGGSTYDYHESAHQALCGFGPIGSADHSDGVGYIVISHSNGFHTGPSKAPGGMWDVISGSPHDHMFLMNGESQITVQFSLNNSTWSAEEDYFAYTDAWQQLGYRDIDITDAALGGIPGYGDKTVYVRFVRRRPNPAGYGDPIIDYSVISATVSYMGGQTIITELLLGYTVDISGG